MSIPSDWSCSALYRLSVNGRIHLSTSSYHHERLESTTSGPPASRFWWTHKHRGTRRDSLVPGDCMVVASSIQIAIQTNCVSQEDRTSETPHEPVNQRRPITSIPKSLGQSRGLLVTEQEKTKRKEKSQYSTGFLPCASARQDFESSRVGISILRTPSRALCHSQSR